MEIYFSDINKNDEVSLDSIKGHNGLKYSMAVAVAGRHNILAYGRPGCGKTMVLQHMPELMPKLLPEESQSTTRIHSIAGLLSPNEGFKTDRPFRMPHQTVSIEGTAATTSCNRYIMFSDITEHFHITQKRLDELKDDIVDELQSKEQICDSEGVVLEDDAFNLLFWGNYCDVDCEKD